MHGLVILIWGFVFGAILRYARLNRFDTISGLATLEDLTVAKAIALAVGVGALLVHLEIALGWASFHIKPFLAGGIILGGLLFGIGMAILGYCPGTLAISMGEGSLDALAGIVGGLLGGWVFTLVLPALQSILGPNLGKLYLVGLIPSGVGGAVVVIFLGLLFMAIAFALHAVDRNRDTRWVVAGVLLGLLDALLFLKGVENRPIGASTAYPYLADLVTGTTHNAYFEKITRSGAWEAVFLAGAALAGLVLSLIRKEFRLVTVHERWRQHRGSQAGPRLAWAFVGGFLLIFGARMAGGCTSGHILSGGMQLALSSLTFLVFVTVGLLGTGWGFYRRSA